MPLRLWRRGSYLGKLIPRGHLAISEDTFGCHSVASLLASKGWRPIMLFVRQCREDCPRTKDCPSRYINPAEADHPTVRGRLRSLRPSFWAPLAQPDCATRIRTLVPVVSAFLTPVTTDEETFPGVLKIACWQREQDFGTAIFTRPYLPGNVLSVGYYHIIVHILHVKITHLL